MHATLTSEHRPRRQKQEPGRRVEISDVLDADLRLVAVSKNRRLLLCRGGVPVAGAVPKLEADYLARHPTALTDEDVAGWREWFAALPVVTDTSDDDYQGYIYRDIAGMEVLCDLADAAGLGILTRIQRATGDVVVIVPIGAVYELEETELRHDSEAADRAIVDNDAAKARGEIPISHEDVRRVLGL